jgi:hypothetical protein
MISLKISSILYIKQKKKMSKYRIKLKIKNPQNFGGAQF